MVRKIVGQSADISGHTQIIKHHKQALAVPKQLRGENTAFPATCPGKFVSQTGADSKVYYCARVS